MKPKPSQTGRSVDELPLKSHPKSMRPIGRAELRANETTEERARRYRVSGIILVLGLLYALVAFAMHSCRG